MVDHDQHHHPAPPLLRHVAVHDDAGAGLLVEEDAHHRDVEDGQPEVDWREVLVLLHEEVGSVTDVEVGDDEREFRHPQYQTGQVVEREVALQQLPRPGQKSVPGALVLVGGLPLAHLVEDDDGSEHQADTHHDEGDDLEGGGLVTALAAAAVVEVHVVVTDEVQQHLSGFVGRQLADVEAVCHLVHRALRQAVDAGPEHHAGGVAAVSEHPGALLVVLGDGLVGDEALSLVESVPVDGGLEGPEDFAAPELDDVLQLHPQPGEVAPVLVQAGLTVVAQLDAGGPGAEHDDGGASASLPGLQDLHHALVHQGGPVVVQSEVLSLVVPLEVEVSAVNLRFTRRGLPHLLLQAGLRPATGAEVELPHPGVSYEDEVVVAAPESVVLETPLSVGPGVPVHHAAPGLPLTALQVKLLITLLKINIF